MEDEQKRIGRIEGDVHALTGAVEGLIESQKLTNRKIDNLAGSVAGINATAGQIPTGVIFSICALVVALVGGATSIGQSFVAQEIKRVDATQQLSHSTINQRFDFDDDREIRDQAKYERFLVDWGKLLGDVERLKNGN